jgi:hypothetical protein
MCCEAKEVVRYGEWMDVSIALREDADMGVELRLRERR